jgi:hypothetical protein
MNFKSLVLVSCEGFTTDGLAAVAANCRWEKMNLVLLLYICLRIWFLLSLFSYGVWFLFVQFWFDCLMFFYSCTVQGILQLSSD